MQKKPRTPAGLSSEAQRWWKRIVSEYEIGDSGGRLVLQTMLEAFDTMRRAQAVLEAEGLNIIDRFGQKKVHPLCAVERDARGQVYAGLKALNLDLEPIKNIGRPGGSFDN